MNELHLFAGIGGGILGGMLCGHTTICAVEIIPFRQQVLLQRQRDGILPVFPIWDNVKTFAGKPWQKKAQVVCGGFPCKGISTAKTNNPNRTTRNGLQHHASKLWHHQARIIREVEPEEAFIENTPTLKKNGLDKVLQDLAAMGFDVRWDVFSCGDFGAPHERKRIWILASHPNRAQRNRRSLSSRIYTGNADACRATWWKNKPKFHGVDEFASNRVDRLGAIGDCQSPLLVAHAYSVLKNTFVHAL